MTMTLHPLPRTARALAILAIAAGAPTVSGCSLIGAGIGSVVPRYESIVDVEVTTRSST